MFYRLARPCVLALLACVLLGAAPPPPKPAVAITLANLGTLEGGKLLGNIVAHYLKRDYVGKKDAAVKALQYLAPTLDDLPGNLKYSFVGGKPRIEYDARRKLMGPEAEKALRELVEHCFTAVAKDGYQSAGGTKYTLDKGLVAPLVGSVVVLWMPGPDPALLLRLKALEAKLKLAEDEIALLKARAAAAEKERKLAEADLLAVAEEIGRLEEVVKKLAQRKAGHWAVVYTWAVDCCGCWSPVAWWTYVSAKPGAATSKVLEAIEKLQAPAIIKRLKMRGKTEAAAPKLPPPLDTSRMTKNDATALFWKGYEEFHDRDYAAAWKLFEAATRLSNDDARFWYYRALAERTLGDNKAAEASRQSGIKAEKKNKKTEQLAYALERIQGERRLWLRLGNLPAKRE